MHQRGTMIWSQLRFPPAQPSPSHNVHNRAWPVFYTLQKVTQHDVNRLYRVAQKECNTYDQWFQENEGQKENVVCIIAYQILFPARWHQNQNFDEGVWILWPFFWGNVIFKICPSISKASIYVRKFSIVWLTRVNCQLLLCKAKPAWIIKTSNHYITLQHYNPGGATQRNSSLPQTWLLIQKDEILEITLPHWL